MIKRSHVLIFAAFAPLLFPACTGNPTAPTVYERIVIDVHGPIGAGNPEDIDITLYLDEDGSLTWVTEDVTPSDPGFIDTEGMGLTSGTYYIQMNHESIPAILGQAYTVRAITLASGEAVPGTDVPTALPTINWGDPDPYDFAGETYSNTTAQLYLDTNWVQRYLYPGSETDWLRLVLP